jgi:hypothetical protein
VFLLRSDEERLEPPRVKPDFRHLAVGSGLAAVIILAAFQLIPLPSLSAQIAIIIFNFLFAFLLFPLEGPLLPKVCLLVAGNIVGASWYLIQSSLQEASFLFMNVEAFKIVAVVLSPIIDFIWIVSLWSLSLSVLASANKTRRIENKS